MKPRQTNQKVRCLNCGNICRDKDCQLHHAGSIDGKSFWNTECPKCGVYDMMNHELYEMTEKQFKKEKQEMENKQ